MNDKIVKKRRISLMWVVPVCAALVAVWLVVKARSERGPEIVVLFEQADGLEQGKTQVNFRGVKVGVVKRLEILKDFRSVAAHIQLEKFAAGLARENSAFWIEKPVLSLAQGISGLETLISGNYIVVEGNGEGAEKYEFKGLKKEPPIIAQEESFSIKLTSRHVPNTQEVEPIYYRGVKIGMVDRHEVDSAGTGVTVYVEIRPEFRHLIRQGARFWPVPLINVAAGPGVVELHVPSPGTMLRGGIEMGYFGGDASGPEAEEQSVFEMFPSEQMARCVGPAFEVSFENAQGLLAEKTLVRYRGIPVGLVLSVQPEPARGKVRLKARLFEGYNDLLKEESAFWLVRPVIGLQGAQGMETLFSGVYLECRPGPGRAKFAFEGLETQPHQSVEGPATGRYVLRTDRSLVPLQAPVYYRGVEVGRVVGKELSPDARNACLMVEVAEAYRPLVRANTRFYNVSGLDAYFGFLGIKVRADSVESIVEGGVAFATPEGNQMGAPAKDGQFFDLYDKAEPAWLKWSPQIPLGGR